jgi:hypothetical protein
MTASQRPTHIALVTPHTPSQAGWEYYDAPCMAEHLHALRDSGFTHICLRPPWHWLQPRPGHIQRQSIDRLEQILDIIATQRLSAFISLLDVEHAGRLALPDWHNAPDVIGWMQGQTTRPFLRRGTPVLINGRLRTLNMANPFTTDVLTNAHQLLVRSVLGYFAGHPAANDWLIGHGWGRLATATAPHMQTWWQTLMAHARQAHPGARLWASIDEPQLTTSPLTLTNIAPTVDGLVVGTPQPGLDAQARRRLSDPALFMHHLVAGLSEKPVVSWLSPIAHQHGGASHTLPIQWHQQPWGLPSLTSADQANYYATLLTRLHAAGSHGIVHTHARGALPEHDYEPTAWHDLLAPLLDAQGERHLAGDAVADSLRQWQTMAEAPARLDAERYWYKPQSEWQRMWREFA